jgi:hypothetical protein
VQKRFLDGYPERVNEDWNRMPFVPGFHVHLKNMSMQQQSQASRLPGLSTFHTHSATMAHKKFGFFFFQ